MKDTGNGTRISHDWHESNEASRELSEGKPRTVRRLVRILIHIGSVYRNNRIVRDAEARQLREIQRGNLSYRDPNLAPSSPRTDAAELGRKQVGRAGALNRFENQMRELAHEAAALLGQGGRDDDAEAVLAFYEVTRRGQDPDNVVAEHHARLQRIALAPCDGKPDARPDSLDTIGAKTQGQIVEMLRGLAGESSDEFPTDPARTIRNWASRAGVKPVRAGVSYRPGEVKQMLAWGVEHGKGALADSARRWAEQQAAVVAKLNR